MNDNMRRQAKRVLDYMEQYGGITSLEAFKELGITRLAAVIFDIKKAGVPIKTERFSCPNRYGEQVSFARYSIITNEEDV